MKKFFHIGEPLQVPENARAIEAVKEFARVYELSLDQLFYYRFEESDPKRPLLLNVLADHGFGLFPKINIGPDCPDDYKRFVRYRETIEFEREDAEAAEYLKPEPLVAYEGINEFFGRSGHPIEYAFRGRVPKRWKTVDISFHRSTWERYIVSERARVVLEEAGLRHAVFKPLVCDEYYRQHGAPMFWELTSDLLLPPMSRSIKYRDVDWRLCPPDDPRPVTRFPRPEDGMWAYERSEIESVGPFDVARTAEPNQGPTMPLAPETNLIVSKKFYELFRDHGFKCSWIPVRIIEDK